MDVVRELTEKENVPVNDVGEQDGRIKGEHKAMVRKSAQPRARSETHQAVLMRLSTVLSTIPSPSSPVAAYTPSKSL